MSIKQCTKCKEYKPETEQFFYKQKKRSKKKGVYYDLQSWCKDCTLNKQKEYQAQNRDAQSKRYKKWYRKNREYKDAYHQQWVEENFEQNQTNQRKWQRHNPDKLKIYNDLHRNHDISDREWEFCKIYFNYECAYCGINDDIHKRLTGRQLHKEHVIHSGRNDIKNCVPSCGSCNSSKRTQSLSNWYNANNRNYTYERYFKIYKWLRYDCKFIAESKSL
jgi:hypothetical protein